MARSLRPTSWLIPAIVLAAPAGAAAQTITSSREHDWRLELGGAYSTPLVRDANGTDVRAPWGMYLGAGSAWTVAPRTRVALSARGAVSPLRVTDDGATWDGGRSWILDAFAAVERHVWERLTLRGAVGVVLLRGPRDMLPFRSVSGTGAAHASAEVGLGVRLASARPFFATMVAQGFRAGGATVGDPIDEPGAVMRLLAGIRYGR